MTDVSVRVDPLTQAEIVTYCGISSLGNIQPQTPPSDPLTPVQPFQFTTSACGGVQAAGNVNNGAGSWDGFVGRLQRSTGTTTTLFHSIVGGTQQDGLFGLAEITDSLFAVVGTVGGANGVGGTGTAEFPFSSPTAPCSNAGPVGAVLVFEAPSPGTVAPLTLRFSQEIGTGAAGEGTCARDIAVAAGWSTQGGPVIDLLVVVGASNDPTVVGANPGSADGYLRQFAFDRQTLTLQPAPTLTFGGPNDPATRPDGLFGVQGWSDYQDYFAVAGVIGKSTAGAVDHDVLVSTVNSNLFPASSPIRMREVVLGGTGDDRVVALGEVFANPPPGSPFGTPWATDDGLPFPQRFLGNPQGGGVCMEPNARVTVVGATDSPATPPLNGFPTSDRLRMTLGTTLTQPDPVDAVRVSLDMLPPLVGRTDGTGAIATPVAYPLPGLFGGTTPECGLKPFGFRVGDTSPGVRRVLIDYQDPAPGPGLPVVLVVTRPPSVVSAAAWQFGLPGVASPPIALPDGLVLWTATGGLVQPLVAVLPDTSFATTPLTLPPLGSLPPGSAVFSAQLVCLLPSPGLGGTGPAPCTGTSQFVASPAIWLRY